MKVIIIGAGLGGLAAALRLQIAGHQVCIYEKLSVPGGRAGVIAQDGYTFDTGPTLLMMVDVLEQLFSDCGQQLSDYITITQLESNYKAVFADHSTITMTPDLARLTDELASIDPQAPEQFFALLSRLASMYQIARYQFIDKNYDRLSDFINLTSVAKLAYFGGLRKLTSFIGKYLKDPRLVQLFSFQAMYLGISPYQAPAIYSIIAYLETTKGIWYPQGGMHQIARALARLLKDLGGQICYDSAAKRILVSQGQATGIELENGDHVAADIVISNADLTYSYEHLLNPTERPGMPDHRLNSLKHSSSAIMFYWGVNHPLANLKHHNLYFSADFKSNLQQIFDNLTIPTDASFYIHVPTKTDPELAPPNRQIISILVPVPNLTAKIDWKKAQAEIKAQVLNILSSHFDADIKDKIETEAIFMPLDFKTNYNLTYGAAFGLSHYFLQSGFFRPHNYVKGARGLYLTGASTYPGSGIPMVLLSGKLVSERILKDYARA